MKSCHRGYSWLISIVEYVYFAYPFVPFSSCFVCLDLFFPPDCELLEKIHCLIIFSVAPIVVPDNSWHDGYSVENFEWSFSLKELTFYRTWSHFTEIEVQKIHTCVVAGVQFMCLSLLLNI